ncbi:hypothetical protein EYF80_019214 [Liparis tanakae]|uniref:Uncharacterized protein n=1 Tax=Liparis tanakae TaxID=230148 RepID=A0A4Z2HYL1_9TELE|nr:hypothetical protein EYF80_019214 [Liparis tanakae]
MPRLSRWSIESSASGHIGSASLRWWREATETVPSDSKSSRYSAAFSGVPSSSLSLENTSSYNGFLFLSEQPRMVAPQTRHIVFDLEQHVQFPLPAVLGGNLVLTAASYVPDEHELFLTELVIAQ